MINTWINMEQWWNATDKVQQNTQCETLVSLCPPHIPHTHTGLRLNPGLYMETLVTNYLTHSMATFLRTSLVTRLTWVVEQQILCFKSTKHWLYIYSKTFNIRLVRSVCTGWIFQNFSTHNQNPIYCNTTYIKLYYICNKLTNNYQSHFPTNSLYMHI